jgi:N-acyl homoserine lactone hydrolase
MTTNNAAPQRLYLMQVAISMVAPCYLVQTGDGKNILIDSGLPLQMPGGFQLPPNVAPPVLGESVITQLAKIGIQPADIDILVATHFDMDHAGNHDAFTNAEVVVQRSHYELAKSGYPRFARSRSHWDHPALRYRLVDGDTELVPGLKLIETSGHTKGHQAVLVRLPHTGPVLLTIDSVPTQSAFTMERKASRLDEDEEGLLASTRKLLDLVEREHVNLVIFGHDSAQWQMLKTLPDYYD